MEEDSSDFLAAFSATQDLLASKTVHSGLLQAINSEVLRLSPENIPERTSKQCNVTWTSGCIAYKCRDCQFDSTWYGVFMVRFVGY